VGAWFATPVALAAIEKSGQQQSGAYFPETAVKKLEVNF